MKVPITIPYHIQEYYCRCGKRKLYLTDLVCVECEMKLNDATYILEDVKQRIILRQVRKWKNNDLETILQ
jgi:hypothetical protein